MPNEERDSTLREDARKPEEWEDAKAKAIACAREATHLKAQDLALLDVSMLSSFADYFVICSGRSSRQVQGIADNLETSLGEMGLTPLGIEGRREGHWVLMDYGDVIIHIFYEPVRYFYDLESLWAEAKKMSWEEESIEMSNPDLG